MKTSRATTLGMQDQLFHGSAVLRVIKECA